jgi:hypothetical protein
MSSCWCLFSHSEHDVLRRLAKRIQQGEGIALEEQIISAALEALRKGVQVRQALKKRVASELFKVGTESEKGIE